MSDMSRMGADHPSGRHSLRAALFALLFLYSGASIAALYCFPAHWDGLDLVNAANGQATIDDATCGCGDDSQNRWIDSGGGCSSSAATRTTSAANSGDSWSVRVRSDYVSLCFNTSDITVSGSCSLSGKSQWYDVVATCSNHNTAATVTMNSGILPLAPCTIEYMADSHNTRPVRVRDVIKFKNKITVTTAAPAYAPIGTVFPVAATATVGTVTITTSGNCTATSTGAGMADITMTGGSSADCVVNYSSGSDATYGSDAASSNTNNNYYEGIYGGIKVNWEAFYALDWFMTCGPTCAVTAADSHAWLANGGSSRVYGLKDADAPADSWVIKVADGTGADTTYTIASVLNGACMAKSGSDVVFAACNAGSSEQQWKIAAFAGSDPSDAPAGVELTLPAHPGLYANAGIGYLAGSFPIKIDGDHDWTSAFFLVAKSPLPDHFRFEFDPAGALLCQPMPLTIKACSNPTASDPTCAAVSGLSLTVTPGASVGTWSGLVGGKATFVGTSSGIKLAHTIAEATTFSYSTSIPMAANTALECYDSATASVIGCTNAATYTSCSFKAVEVGANPATAPNLYTKLANVGFSFDVVGPTAYIGNVVVDLVDASSAAWACPAAPTLLASAAFTAPSAATGSITTTLSAGRRTFTVSNADPVKKVRVRVRDAVTPTPNCYHSDDHFTIRPTGFTLALGNAGNPLIAGQSTDGVATAFTLTATARNGWSGATTTGNVGAGYNGTPTVEWATAAPKDWTNTALPYAAGNFTPATLVTGGFAAATGVTATGSYYYDDFGTLTLANAANIVVDKTFADGSGDIVNGDCDPTTSPYGNALSSGKYGCYVGSTAPATLTTNRFRPKYFVAASGVTAAPACSSGRFTYFGQKFLGSAITLTAKSASGTTLSRLHGSPTNAPAYYVTAVNGASVLASHGFATSSADLPTAALPATAWVSGVYTVAGTDVFAKRLATPDGPYDDFKAALTVNDADSVRITSCTDGAGNSGTITDGQTLAGAVAATLSNCTPPNSASAPKTTRMRFGRMTLGNEGGSPLLPLFLPLQVWYWNGGWVVNTDDSCTNVPATRLAAGNTKPAGWETLVVGALNLTMTSATFANGVTSIRVPGPALASIVGTADIGVNLGSGTALSSCVGGLPATTAAADLSFLRGNWCGGSYDRDPVARATFNTSKGPFLYRREKY